MEFRIKLGNELVSPTTGPRMQHVLWDMAWRVKDDYANKDYNNYRKVSLVRKCVNLVSQFETQKGFNTIIEPLDPTDDPNKYIDVKRAVDAINRRVNMDGILKIASVKGQIYGNAGFEILKDADDDPKKLIPLKSDLISPIQDENWEVTGFKYPGLTNELGNSIEAYDPNEILYFVRTQLEADLAGISEVEPVRRLVEIKRNLEQDIEETAKRLWAPMVFVKVDTSGFVLPTEEAAALTKVTNELQPGRSYVHNQSIIPTKVDALPNLESLKSIKESIDEEIIGNWGVPKALLARERTLNRATIEVSVKVLYEGPIQAAQREFKRQLEAQWYDPIVNRLGYADKIRMRHVWKPISLKDFIEMAKPLADLVVAKVIDRTQARKLLDLDPSLTSDATLALSQHAQRELTSFGAKPPAAADGIDSHIQLGELTDLKRIITKR